MKKNWALAQLILGIAMVSISLFGLVFSASAGFDASQKVCPQGGDWSEHQDPPLHQVDGATNYCVKGGSENSQGCVGYRVVGSYSEVQDAVKQESACAPSHWSYEKGQTPPTATNVPPTSTPTDVGPTITPSKTPPTETNTPEPTETPGQDPTPTETPDPNVTPTATAEPTEDPSPTPTEGAPSPTPTAQNTSEPQPSSTPHPVEEPPTAGGPGNLLFPFIGLVGALLVSSGGLGLAFGKPE
mgnify:CR=1 FL=1